MTQEDTSILPETPTAMADLHVPPVILNRYLYFQLDFDKRRRFNQWFVHPEEFAKSGY